jgi:uncharacterized membrane protein
MLGNINRKVIKGILYAAFLLVLPGVSCAEEVVRNYVVQITVNENSSVDIFETIEYDFGDYRRHGIYRDIPIKYKANIGNRDVRLNIKSVSRDGFPEPYSETRHGDDKRLKIGDANTKISGLHTYRIGYTVFGALNSFEDFDELYWNAIPDGWEVPILNVTTKITAPNDFLSTSCYKGKFGSKEGCESVSVKSASVTYSSQNLEAYEGMTIVVSLPKGAVNLPSLAKELLWWLKSNFVIFIPLFVFFIMYRIWNEKGRDAKGRGTIIPRYEPPIALTPAFLGSVVDGTLNDSDITADIIYLAEQGYLNINRIDEKKFLGSKTEYILEWRGDYSELDKKEQLVAELIFGSSVIIGESVKLSDLQKDKTISKRRKKLKENIDEELKRKGYFANKPGRTREIYMTAPIIVGTFIFVFWFVNILLSISIVISLLIVVAFGYLMPKRTKKGAEMLEHILGFKDFLSVTEKDRLDFHNAPKRSPKEFMENLPYAIALGVEKKWAEQFKSIHIDSPDWYRGGSISNFTAGTFINDIGDFSTSMSAGVTAAQGGSGSSGGGFSGGGMGGGGGGSW